MTPNVLKLVTLEDRSVPATLSSNAWLLTPSHKASTTADVAPATQAPVHGISVTAAPSQGTYLGRLAANHNQTLVRDRRRGNPRRA